MKRILCIILGVMMFCGMTSGVCETKKPAKAVYIEVGTDREIDLVNSGIPQTVRLQYVGLENDAFLQAVIFGSDGGVNLFDTEINVLDSAAITDADGDGDYEIFLSGRVHAMDYMTYCLEFSDEKGITSVPFADIDRGSERTGYTETGYGLMTAITADGITLTGYQDILGTYVGSRILRLRDGRMELNDDGMWKFELSDEEKEYKALTLKKDLQVTFSDGSLGILNAGEVLYVTASDLQYTVCFETDSGKTGSFSVEPDTAEGWGSLINGINESEYFVYVPYAG